MDTEKMDEKSEGASLPQRVVHLDLKGAPPLMSYLKSILPLLKEAGATALLVEYPMLRAN